MSIEAKKRYLDCYSKIIYDDARVTNLVSNISANVTELKALPNYSAELSTAEKSNVDSISEKTWS